MVEGKAGFHKRQQAHTRQSGLNSGKSERQLRPHQPPIQPSPSCPECGSEKLWKDGLRYLKDGGTVQRWLCRTCGFRFSESFKKRQIALKRNPGFLESKPKLGDVEASNILTVKPRLKNSSLTIREDVASHKHSQGSNASDRYINVHTHSRDCRVCETDGVLKNLVKVETRQKQAAGATRNLATIKGKIIEYLWYLKKQGYAESVVKNRVKNVKRLVDLGADLWDPESVKEILAKQEKWRNSYKVLMVYAYKNFLEMEGLAWQKPRYKADETFPFVPTEQELDQLIIGVGKKMGTFLQGLKDTGADPGELMKLKWIDVNTKTRKVTITPVKGHNPRVLKVSQEFLRRLGTLPRKSEYIFTNLNSMESHFWHARKRLARKLGNPRLEAIRFTTFRHWKGTIEYHRTHSLMHVKQLLGHKAIQSTVLYVHLEALVFDERNDDFHVAVAKNVEEATKLVKVGFEYVTGEYDDGGKIFRKRK